MAATMRTGSLIAVLMTAMMVFPGCACALLWTPPFEANNTDVVDDGPTIPTAPRASRGDFDWPMFRMNLTHQGATFSPGPQNNSLLWSNTTTASSYSSPIVANDILFIGGYDGKVYAFDAKTGWMMWNNTTSAGGEYGVASTGAYADGKVVFANNNDDYLYCFNATTGTRVWKSKSAYSGSYGGGSTTIYNNVVYAGMPNDRLAAVNFTDGSALWNFSIGSNDEWGVSSTPAIANNMVIFGASDYYVYAVNITTHNLVWKFATGGEFYASPTVVGDRVYIGNGSYYNSINNVAFFCLDLDGFGDGNDGWTNESLTGGTDGDLIWRYNMTSSTEDIVSSAAYWNDTIYFGSYDNYLYSLNATTGAYNWRFSTGGDVLSSPAVSDGVVYVAATDGKLYAVYWNNGTQKWVHTGSGVADSSPAIANGVVYYATVSGNVYAVGQYVTLGPSVMSTSPTPGATGVPKSTTVSATFNKALNAATVTSSTFTLVDHLAAPVAGTVSYNGPSMTATFTPSSNLVSLETYTAKLTTGIQDPGGLPMKQDYTWSFTVGNSPPSLTAYGVWPPSGNTSTVFNYFVTYTDLDDQAPSSIKISIDNGTGVAMTVNGSAVAALKDGNFTNGEQFVYNTTLNTSAHSFSFNASDGVAWQATPIVNGPIVISDVNLPPVIATIPVQTATEDVPSTVNLTTYITDPDNTTAQLSFTTVTAQNTTNVTHAGLNMTLTYGEGVLNDHVTFTVSDGKNSANGGFDVAVTPVNDAPTLDALPAQTVSENVSKTLNISSYIHDIDTPISAMMVTTNSIYVKVTGTELNMTVPGPVGTVVVNVTIDDGDNEAWRDLSITVVAAPIANEPPTISGVPDQVVDAGVAKDLDLTPYITDDGPLSALTITTDSSRITESGLVLTMNYPAGFVEELVNITVSDGELSASTIMKVTENVTAPPTNKPPVIVSDTISPGKSGTTDTTFSFSVKARDDDGDTMTVVIEIDGVEHPMTKKGGTSLTGVDFSYEGKFAAGNHTYRFKIDDGKGATNSVVLSLPTSFTVTTPGGGGGDGGTKESGMLGTPMLIVLVLVIVIVIALVAVMMMRKRKGGPEAQVPQQQPLDPSLGYPQQAQAPQGGGEAPPPAPPAMVPETAPPAEQPTVPPPPTEGAGGPPTQ